MTTMGPAYSAKLDHDRLQCQMQKVLFYMLRRDEGSWHSLSEICTALNYPEASVSAQLRHLRKPEFGGYLVDKRRREAQRGLWEYRVRAVPVSGQIEMFAIEAPRPQWRMH